MGLILPQTVAVKSHNYTRKHYTDIGYFVGNIGDIFMVNVLDLPKSSTQKVLVKCDFCGKDYEIEYRKFLLQQSGGTSCTNCRYIKVSNTNLIRYGNVCSLKNEDILQKSKDTNIKKLGVEYPFQNKYILDKCISTQIKKYGHVGRSINTSSQQIYIHSLYGGEINYYIAPYHVDILFSDISIIFEYDGLGHNLLVKLGKMSQEEFDKKESDRSKFLQESGYKEFHIIADDKDKLPCDDELINIKNNAFDYLINNNYKCYTYNLKTKEIIIF